jgi:hypothetical protein
MESSPPQDIRAIYDCGHEMLAALVKAALQHPVGQRQFPDSADKLFTSSFVKGREVMFPRLLRSSLCQTISKLVLIISCGSGMALAAAQVTIQPGTNIVTAVNNAAAGTTFVIYPGTYRLTAPIVPKTGDTFIGQTACAPPTTSCPAILSGSKLLTSFQHSGSYYYVTGQTQQGETLITTTQCLPGYLACLYPEDLFFDGVPKLRVTALSDVGPGTWFFDYANQTIYFSDNPTGHTVETSATPAAFQSSANNVTIKYLTVEEFAVPVLLGAIGMNDTISPTLGANWTTEYSEIMLNHGSGVKVVFGSQVLNNYIHNNGNLGVGGGTLMGALTVTPPSVTSGILVEGNEVSYNNYAYVKPNYGAGGVKFGNTRGAVLRGNYIHDNLGSGFHADTNNINTLAEGNTINDNTEEGLFNEIGYAATFRNNVLRRNGYTHPDHNEWMYGANILSSVSQGVQAYCNTVEVSSQGGNGMDISAQPRAGYTSGNNYYHHNTVTFDGNEGWNGALNGDRAETQFYSLNRFDYNQYHVPGMTQSSFPWEQKSNAFATFRSMGPEPHGTADTNYQASAPTVAITSPADQATASGTLSVAGTATGSLAISKVEFYVDWTLQSTAGGTSPFNFSWNTSGATAGAHTLAAMAYNTDGISSCNAITVNVP